LAPSDGSSLGCESFCLTFGSEFGRTALCSCLGLSATTGFTFLLLTEFDDCLLARSFGSDALSLTLGSEFLRAALSSCLGFALPLSFTLLLCAQCDSGLLSGPFSGNALGFTLGCKVSLTPLLFFRAFLLAQLSALCSFCLPCVLPF
jgi:hypothetical protein